MRINKDSLYKGRNNLVKPEFEGLVFSQYLKQHLTGIILLYKKEQYKFKAVFNIQNSYYFYIL